MDSDGSLPQFIALVFLLILSAFFSSAETALTSLSKIRLKHMVSEGVKGADAIEKITENPKRLLTSILIGNNLVNVGASVVTTGLAIKLSGNNAFAIGAATFLLTFAILVFGEVTPKTLANQYSEKFSLFLAEPIKLVVLVFTPAAALLGYVTSGMISLFGGDPNKSTPLITEAEFKTIVNVSEEEGVLEVFEKRVIHNVFDFGDFHSRDIMTPRTDIFALSDEATYEEAAALFKEERFSRVPVYKESLDRIVGILHLKDFAFLEPNEFDIKVHMRNPFFTYESKPTRELFNLMRNEGIAMTIILDEYGGTAGLVTLEDLVEEIVGEISDEYDDEEKEIEEVREHEYIVEGGAKISDVNEMLETDIESEDYESIGGFVVGVLGHIPKPGEEVSTEGLKFIIEEVEKNRIVKLRIYT